MGIGIWAAIEVIGAGEIAVGVWSAGGATGNWEGWREHGECESRDEGEVGGNGDKGDGVATLLVVTGDGVKSSKVRSDGVDGEDRRDELSSASTS